MSYSRSQDLRQGSNWLLSLSPLLQTSENNQKVNFSGKLPLVIHNPKGRGANSPKEILERSTFWLEDKVEPTVLGWDGAGERSLLLFTRVGGERLGSWRALQTCKEVSLGCGNPEREARILARSWSGENRDKCFGGFGRKDPSVRCLFSWAEANA